MRKRDFLTPIGITLGFIMLMLAIMTNSGTEGVASFADIPSLFIVIGGLVASMLVTFKIDQIKLTGKMMKEAFHKNDMQLPELTRLFVRLSERARREGILALESELEDIEDPFIKKGVLLAVDGIDPEVITDIMNAEITAMEDRHYKGEYSLKRPEIMLQHGE